MNIKNIDSISAYKLIETNLRAVIVDVRTAEEWQAGIPQLDNGKVFFISWRLFHDNVLNDQFANQFMINIQDKKIPVLFLCRSGIRSLEAAQFASSIGYTDCYNILDGFQGTIKGAGWQKNNLPWKSL